MVEQLGRVTPPDRDDVGALAADDSRWATSRDAADFGAFDYDLATGVLEWDDRLLALFGYGGARPGGPDGGEPFDGTIGAFNRRVHPDDLQLVTDASTDAVASLGRLQENYRIVLPDGRLRWMHVRGGAVAGPDGAAARLVGVVFDVTDARHKEQRAEQILEAMSVGFVSIDVDWTITYVNAEAERLTQGDRRQLLGGNLWELFPAARGEPFEPVYRRVARTRVTETLEGWYPEPMNTWVEVRIVPEPGGGVSYYFLDIGERRRAQQLLQLSVDVGQQLIGAAEVSEAATALARAVVPVLADWSMVALREPGGRVRDVRGIHRDPARQRLVDSFMAHRMVGGSIGVIDDVLADQQPRTLDAAGVAAACGRLPSDVARAALVELAPASVTIQPLQAGTRSVGVLLLARSAERPALTTQEHDLIATICRRAGLAIDNARLNEQLATAAEHDRGVAAQLQRALLTELPELDTLQLVARYLTAVDAHQVGGDWTDAVVQPDGATTVVVGDVAGHDIDAAALMGQLRGMLRTLAWLGDTPPAQLLTQLDRAAHDLRIRTTATAVVARIEQTEDEAAAGLRTLRWSNAGHPPPVLLHPDGRTELLEPDGKNDVLLGVAPETVRRDHTRTLPDGCTLLLYTDGLIETRDADLDTGIARLREALTRHHRLDPDDLADAVLTDLVGDRTREDDTALLAVRFHARLGG